MKLVNTDISGAVLARIENAGWVVKIEPLRARKRKGLRVEEKDHPGLKLTAVRNGKSAASASARDWSVERAKLEAACLLAKQLNLRLAA